MESPAVASIRTSDKSAAQTLDRGIQVLEVLADAGDPLPVATIAGRLGVDRSVVYRLLRTLGHHRLVVRMSDGRVRLGTGLLALSSRLSGDLQTAAAPELARLAADLGATAFITIADDGEAVCLAAAEPRHTNVHVAYRPGLRHSLEQGASSVALRAGQAPVAGERPQVTRARTMGYAISRSEVQPGTIAVAAPIRRPDSRDAIASVAVVSLIGALDADGAAPRVIAAAEAIAKALS